MLHPLPDADRTGCAAGPPVAVSTSVWLRLGSRFEVKYSRVPYVSMVVLALYVPIGVPSRVSENEPKEGPVGPKMYAAIPAIQYT